MMTMSANLMTKIDDAIVEPSFAGRGSTPGEECGGIDGEDTQEIPLIEIELAVGCYGAGPRGLVSSANGRSKVETGSVSGEISGRAAPRRHTLPGW